LEKIPVLIIDKNLNIVYLNEYAKNIYGNKTGEKCFKTLKGKNSPCTVHCPVINQENIVIAGKDRCIDAVNCKEKTLYKILRNLNETVALSVDEKDILKKFCSVLSQVSCFANACFTVKSATGGDSSVESKSQITVTGKQHCILLFC